MTPEHVATVLATLGASYRTDITGDMAEVWYEHFVDVPDEVATIAIDLVIRDEAYFPSPAVFRRYVPQARRQVDDNQARHRDGPPPVCPMCDGERWYPGRAPVGEMFPHTRYEAIRPCQSCAPVQFDRWRRYIADEAARRRVRRPEQFDFDPSALLADARRAIVAAAKTTEPDEED